MHCLLLCAEKKRAFVKRRKMHYNEFQAVKLARQLIADEDDDDDDEDDHIASAGIDPSVPHETDSYEAASSLQHAAGDTDADHMQTEDVV